MSSTNKTTNYNLSQFVGTDKPAWLADYNQDMSKIDTQMKANADSATGADGKADANTSAIGTLTNLTTEAKTNLVSAINEVDLHADTAQNTANQAVNSITGLQDYLNLNSYISATNGTSDNGNVVTVNIKYASNSNGSLGKIYGYVDVQPSTAKDSVVTITEKSSFRPEARIFIQSLGIESVNGGTIAYPVDVAIETDGTIKFYAYMEGLNRTHRLIIHPCLLFITDFGDTPSNS
jgi:hypothetical protein